MKKKLKLFQENLIEYIKPKFAQLIIDAKLRKLLWQEKLKELTDWKYTKETNVALTELVMTGIAPTVVIQNQTTTYGIEHLKTDNKLEGDLKDLLFSPRVIKEFKLLNLFSYSLELKTLDDLYNFLKENKKIVFTVDRNSFDRLIEVAYKCNSGEIKTRRELDRILSLPRGGEFDLTSFGFMILVLIMWSNQGQGFRPECPPLRHPPFGGLNRNGNGRGNQHHHQGKSERGPSSLKISTEVIQHTEDGVTAIANDGKSATATMKHSRKKGYHMGDFLTNKEILDEGGDPHAIRKYGKGQSLFSDLTIYDDKKFEKERNAYFADENKVPESLIRLFAERLVDFCRRDDVYSASGIMAWKETPGTMFIDGATRTVAFRDQTGEIKSGCQLNKEAFLEFLTGEKPLHLYPNAGKPKNN